MFHLKPETCQRCGAARVARIDSHSRDSASVDLAGRHHCGYMPWDLGIGGGDGARFDFCLDCGQIQGKFPLPQAELERPPEG